MRYDQANAFQTVSPNELCHCGRLELFKDCCQRFAPKQRLQRTATLTLEERSALTVDAVRYFFLDGKGDEVDMLRARMTASRVGEFYRYIADLWSFRIDTVAALRELANGDMLTGYYVGVLRPQTILRNISRISLYSDRVFVPQPFHTPWKFNEEYDPVIHPDLVRQDTQRWSIAVLILEPWIRSGLVVLVPEPRDYDRGIQSAFLASGLARQRQGKVAIHPDDLSQHEKYFKEDIMRDMLSLPNDVIIRQMKERIGLDDAQVPEMLDFIERQRKEDPFYLPGVMQGEGSLRAMSVPTIEDIVLGCGLTRAFPFTDLRGKWEEIFENADTLPADAEVWSPVSKAFTDLKFEFLDGVDAKFAYGLREDGRLLSFRRFMRALWKTIDGTTSIDSAQRHARDLADELTVAYTQASAEWKQIHAKYDAAVGKSAVASAVGGVAASFTTGFLGVGLSLAMHLLTSGVETKSLDSELRAFRARVPMSIFLDLRSARVG